MRTPGHWLGRLQEDTDFKMLGVIAEIQADARRATVDDVLRVLGRYGLRASGIEDNIRALLDDAGRVT